MKNNRTMTVPKKMKNQRAERFDAIGRLFRYPGDDYDDDVRALLCRLEEEDSRVAANIRVFAEYTNAATLHELEETYTRTFDLNPSCSPEIGWHLFGEEYIRGLFMVHMRNEMRERGLEETGELPDHLVHVLAVLADMDEEPAREMARACVCPAIGKMLTSIDKEQANAKASAAKDQAEGRQSTPVASQPFRPLVEGLSELMLEEFDFPSSALEGREEEQNPFPAGVDPLHSMPGGLCGGCGGSELVSLDAAEVTSSTASEGHRTKERRP